jgi:hypothetical protein
MSLRFNKKISVPLAAVLLAAGALFLFQSSPLRLERTAQQSDSGKVLARIGDRTITVDEFIRRAEYTVRPGYCQGNSGVEKKIVLNSLIGEKLLALEAGERNELYNNQRYNRYVQGRREQAMRQLLWEQEGLQKVVLDTADIRAMVNLAGRTYRVDFFNVFDGAVARSLTQQLSTKEYTFEQAYRSAGGKDSIPSRTVGWQDAELPALRSSMFARPLRVGEILPAIEVEDSLYLFVRINGWTTRVAVSDQDTRQRWNDVMEDMRSEQGAARFREFAAGVMRGKSITFERETFRAVGPILAPLYFTPTKAREETFLQQSLGKPPDLPTYTEVGKRFTQLHSRPLFEIDGKTWTVGDFQLEFERHPLVFRKKRFTLREFPEQLKLAIVDQIRDRYLTGIAYERGLDNHPAVRQYVEMWKDADLALFRKREILQRVSGAPGNALEIMTRHVDSLQEAYGDRVEIDVETFNSLTLTRVSAFVIQKDVPFPVYVPSFPILTTDHTLDYGRKFAAGGTIDVL